MILKEALTLLKNIFYGALEALFETELTLDRCNGISSFMSDQDAL